MKKFISLFLALILICPQVFASNLYLLRNTNASVISPLVEDGITKKNYYIEFKNPYCAYEIGNKKEVVTIILHQAGNDLYYFYKSLNNKADVDKAIQRNLKRANIVYEQTYNTSYIQTFENQAANVKSTKNQSQKKSMNEVASSTVYTFDDATYNNTVQQAPATYNSNVLKGYVGEVAAGTSFAVFLQTPINTATAQDGDQVTAVLTQDWIYRNNIIAPQGSVVSGFIEKARPASYGSRNGRVIINFNQLVTPDGKKYNISTEKVDFSVTNDGKWAKAAGSVVGASIAGALIGLIFGAIGGGDIGPAVAIGAGSGAVLGAAKTGIEQGVDAEIPIYTELELTLDKPMSVVLNY